MAELPCQHNVPDWMAIAIRELGLTLHDFKVFFIADTLKSVSSDDVIAALDRCSEEMPTLLCDED